MQENFKSGYVALVGRPNVGKSTLMNCLIGQKIAITSKRPQTTRNRIQTVYTDERGQIIFLDTPGIHKAENKLGDYMVRVAKKTLEDADLILWLVEPTTFIGKGEQEIARILSESKKEIILVINKIDSLKEEKDLVETIHTYQVVCDFAEIVPVSALRKKNTQELLKTLYAHLPEGPMYFDEDTVTDEPMRDIAAEVIREKALHALKDEVPHGIAVTIEKMHDREDKPICDVEATIICERDSHKGIIIGKKGTMLKKIGSNARYELEQMLECQVNLKIWVKVRQKWRDDKNLMKSFGYDEKKYR